MPTPPLVLIIEDDPLLADIVTIAFTEADYQAKVIQDGQEAVDRLSDLTPDLIVLDLHLPHVSGKDILTRIKETESLDGVKVIITTADVQKADSLRELADHVVVKPFDIFRLIELAKKLHPTQE